MSTTGQNHNELNNLQGELMKKIFLMSLFTFVSTFLFADDNATLESVVCVQGDYKLEVTFSTIGGKGTGSVKTSQYTIYYQNHATDFNDISLRAEGYNDFINAYAWAFSTSDATAPNLENFVSLSTGILGMRALTSGTYTGLSDLTVIKNKQLLMDGASVPCTVVVK